MCRGDEVVEGDAQRFALRANTHRDAAHPLRSNDRLRAIHLGEYGAQAMAVHGGLRAREAGGAAKPGLLVALRGVKLHIARIDDLPGPLACEAEVLVAAQGSQHYDFRTTQAGTILANGRAAHMLADPLEKPPYP